MLTNPRWVSPRTGCSTLMTSAPQSARIAPAAGTNVNCATSRTRTPCITLTMSSLSRTELDRQCRGGTERLAVDVGVVVGDEFDVGQPREQTFQRHPRLHPGQVQAHAGVLTGGKRDVW